MDKGVAKLFINDKPVNNIFGIMVYATEESPDTEIFLSDMKKIIDRTSELKIPVMSFDIRWCDYDKSKNIPVSAQEGAERFYTGNLDKILDYAAQKKVYVILQVLLHNHWALPYWWENYKDNGERYQLIDSVTDPTGLYNLYETPVASYQNDTHRELMTALITKLVKRYKGHPAVIGWAVNAGPTGENGYAPNYIDMMFNQRIKGLQVDFRIAMADYSEFSKNKFRECLEVKYGNIKNLNIAWNTKYSSFKDMIPPEPEYTNRFDTYNKNGDPRQSMSDWQSFRYDALLDEWRFMTELVHRLDPHKVVMGNTGWDPGSFFQGTNNMTVTAVGINEENLIDIDRATPAIISEDYGQSYYCSKIFLTNLVKFNREYKIMRVVSLENWVKLGHPGSTISPDRAREIRDAIRDSGGYMWLVVTLDNYTYGKPDWSWEEVSSLVKNSRNNELENVIIDTSPVKFYYDIENFMSHYFQKDENIRNSMLYHYMGRVFYDYPGQPLYDFISSKHLEEGLLDGDKTKLLIMINQRIIPSGVVEKLKNYITSGGTIFMLGSNGIFNEMHKNKKNPEAVKKLAPSLTDQQIERLYFWGLEEDPISGTHTIPYIVISEDGSTFGELPYEAGSPELNYEIFRNSLKEKINLLKNCKLIFGERPR